MRARCSTELQSTTAASVRPVGSPCTFSRALAEFGLSQALSAAAKNTPDTKLLYQFNLFGSEGETAKYRDALS
jgi:hypothetical protein